LDHLTSMDLRWGSRGGELVASAPDFSLRPRCHYQGYVACQLAKKLISSLLVGAATGSHAAGRGAASPVGGGRRCRSGCTHREHRNLLFEPTAVALWALRLLGAADERLKAPVAIFADVFKDGHRLTFRHLPSRSELIIKSSAFRSHGCCLCRPARVI